ncbi:MAG: hypothetical protein ACJAYV_000655 [Oleispira sp.]|jgi:hypothetical protein
MNIQNDSLNALPSFYLLTAFLLVLVGVSVNVSASEEIFDERWSLDYTVEPKETSISGQSIAELNEELTHIALINCHNGTLNQQQCEQVADLGGHLEMRVNGNQDGELERWSIAVGKLRNGEYAKVLVVQNDLTDEVLQLLIIDSVMPGFSALYFQQGIVMWGMCLSCDVLADIVWQQDTYQVSWLPNQQRAWDDEVLVDNR